jgi:hypothetical protein
LNNRPFLDTNVITREELQGFYISGNGNEILRVVPEDTYEGMLYQFDGAELSQQIC